MYKLTDRNGRLLVLRPDNTTPIARVVTTKLNDDVLPLRLYYMQKVHRASSFHRGHSTEVMQAGAELLGARGMMADIDILTTAFAALAAVRGETFRIELSYAAIYKELIQSLNVDAETAERIVPISRISLMRHWAMSWSRIRIERHIVPSRQCRICSAAARYSTSWQV